MQNKVDPLSTLKHMKRINTKEFIAFEKEYVLETYLSKALPKYEIQSIEDKNKIVSKSKYLIQ